MNKLGGILRKVLNDRHLKKDNWFNFKKKLQVLNVGFFFYVTWCHSKLVQGWSQFVFVAGWMSIAKSEGQCWQLKCFLYKRRAKQMVAFHWAIVPISIYIWFDQKSASSFIVAQYKHWWELCVLNTEALRRMKKTWNLVPVRSPWKKKKKESRRRRANAFLCLLMRLVKFHKCKKRLQENETDGSTNKTAKDV